MANERELKTAQEERYFDLLKAHAAADAENAKETLKILAEQIARAESGMTADEIDAVKERFKRLHR